MPFSLRLIAKPVACRAKPRTQQISREDTLHSPEAAAARTRMSGVCRFGYSLFTMSKTGARDRNHRRNPLLLPIHCRSPRTLIAWGPNLVEVSGIEPLTSCLQSRRSPN